MKKMDAPKMENWHNTVEIKKMYERYVLKPMNKSLQRWHGRAGCIKDDRSEKNI